MSKKITQHFGVSVLLVRIETTVTLLTSMIIVDFKGTQP
jgi:hypothetical protein